MPSNLMSKDRLASILTTHIHIWPIYHNEPLIQAKGLKTDYFKIFRPESPFTIFSTKSFENAIKFDVKKIDWLLF